ncbi:hypothetical protein CSKR_105867 [Clonorchis sinensis]|uniref:Uncharacterized protein n=1 Tax=Clonorchis sinensis TaxID=79923 RepID=A0A3R7CQU8_CLOSI|nr:hypothetical protein CSKR_105867 [Clonorchis sinensis]
MFYVSPYWIGFEKYSHLHTNSVLIGDSTETGEPRTGLQSQTSGCVRAHGELSKTRPYPMWCPPPFLYNFVIGELIGGTHLRRQSGISPDVNRCVHQATVRAVCLYGCETWPVPEAELRRLQVFDNRCLRTIARVGWCRRFYN